MRIVLVLTSLRAGGAERVASTLANEWVEAGHDVTLVTLASVDSDFYPLDVRVERQSVGLLAESAGLVAAVRANVRRLQSLRRKIRALAPDVIVSFVDTTNVLVLMAAIGVGIPVVVSERTDPREYTISRVWSLLRRATYPLATLLVVQTEAVAAWGRRVTRAGRVAVIPNPIANACLATISRQPEERARRVVAVGRLVVLKGFDTLIAAFDRAAATRPEWSLIIAGQGPLEAQLKAQAAAARCADRIRFLGLVQKPEEILSGSEIFVLSSRIEGFPNALAEAMACGCAVVSTDCPSGPAEMITDSIDGLLVPVDGVDRLAGALEALMSDETARRRLGTAAMASAARFRAGRIAQDWVNWLTRASAVAGRAEDTPGLIAER